MNKVFRNTNLLLGWDLGSADRLPGNSELPQPGRPRLWPQRLKNTAFGANIGPRRNGTPAGVCSGLTLLGTLFQAIFMY